MADLVGVVEAAYASAPDDRAWASQVMQASLPALDQGLGVGMALIDLASVVDGPRIRAVAGTPGSESMIAAMLEGTSRTLPAERQRMLEAGPVYSFGRVLGERFRTGHGREILDPLGIRDVWSIVSANPAGVVVNVVVPRPKLGAPPAHTRARWARIGAHLSAGIRLRDASRSDDSPWEAVLSPSGRLLEARGLAEGVTAREQLRHAAIRIDRARARTKRSSDEALETWKGLVDGRWSIVEHFDRDGRRYYLAAPNAPEFQGARTLDALERTVCALRAQGHPLKLIAYELGLSVPRISRAVRSGLDKLGLDHPEQLVALYLGLHETRRERA